MSALLPNEVLAWFVQRGATIRELWRATPTHTIFHHAHAWCSKFEVDHIKFTPLGINGDGVPFAANVRDSLACIAYNIRTDTSIVRLLCKSFQQSLYVGKSLWDALFNVCAWII